MLQNAGVSFAEKVAFSGIMIIFSVILTAMLGFFVGIPLGPYSLLLPLAVFALIAFLRDRQLFYAILLHIGILIIWALLCALIYDTSFDGMSYQKQAVITLKEGWNPVYESCLTQNPFCSYLDIWVWLDNYPKGLWLFSASIYALTNLLETAKAVNIIFLTCVFSLGYDILRTVFRASKGKSLLFALLFSINPVFLQQLFTFYNDLAVGALLLLAAMIGIKLYEEHASKYTYLLLFATIGVSCTVKFTAPALVGLVLLAFGVCYTIKHRKTPRRLRLPVIVVLSAYLAGVLVLGFNPYIVHLIQGKHILHPLMGGEKYDIMSVNTPQTLQGKTELEKLFVSLFSVSENENAPAQYKIPFTMSAAEWEDIGMADPRIGGFGMLFSGALCLSVLLALIAAVSKTKMRASVAITLCVFAALGLFFPESWWARYASYLYYIPVFLILYASNMRALKWPMAVAYLILIVNSCTVFASMAALRTRDTQYIRGLLHEIKADGRPVVVRFNDFPSHIAWFCEQGIRFEVSHDGLDDPFDFYGTTFYQYRDE